MTLSPFVCLHVSLSVHLFCFSTLPQFCLFLHHSATYILAGLLNIPAACLILWLGVWLSGCLAVWLSGCLDAWLTGCLAVWLSGCLAVWLSLCPSVNLSFYSSIHLTLNIHILTERIPKTSSTSFNYLKRSF
jgi:hypothetical protein